MTQKPAKETQETTTQPHVPGHHRHFHELFEQWLTWWKDHHPGSATTVPPGIGHPAPHPGTIIGGDRFPFDKSGVVSHGHTGTSGTDHAASSSSSAQQLVSAMAGFAAGDIGSLAASVSSQSSPPVSIAASLH